MGVRGSIIVQTEIQNFLPQFYKWKTKGTDNGALWNAVWEVEKKYFETSFLRIWKIH